MIDYTKQAKSAATDFVDAVGRRATAKQEVVKFDDTVVLALMKRKTQLSVINLLRAEGDSSELAKSRVEASLGEAKRRLRKRNTFFFIVALVLLLMPLVAFLIGKWHYLGPSPKVFLLAAVFVFMKCRRITF